eukprot:SAG22_NODE_50_length_24611_cov_74.139687_7_plen_494_part_00
MPLPWGRRQLLLLLLLRLAQPAAAPPGGGGGGQEEGREASVQQLLRWADARGAKGCRQLRHGSSAYGGSTLTLAATAEPIKSGSLQVSVPLELLLTDRVARASPHFAAHVHRPDAPAGVAASPTEPDDHNRDIDSCSAVALFLLVEKLLPGQDSKWTAYINALPPPGSRFNIPTWEWGASEAGRAALAVLGSASPSMAALLANATAAHKRDLVRFAPVFRSVAQAGGGGGEVAAVEAGFVWAKSVVQSRSWKKDHDLFAGECMLVPVVDMVNHDDSGGGLVAVAGKIAPTVVHSVGVLATATVQPGQAVTANYDPPDSRPAAEDAATDDDGSSSDSVEKAAAAKCIQDMLLTFGFLPTATSHRRWCFNLNISLGRSRSGGASWWAATVRDGDRALRTVLPGLVWAIRQHSETADETVALHTLHEYITEVLSSIPGDEASDRKMLEEEGGNPMMKIAVEVRLHERRVCTQLKMQVEDVLPMRGRPRERKLNEDL